MKTLYRGDLHPTLVILKEKILARIIECGDAGETYATLERFVMEGDGDKWLGDPDNKVYLGLILDYLLKKDFIQVKWGEIYVATIPF